ncbi:hypothetical protein DPMN_184092 [Dreissena polymorpha]|uniref:Uncharacterized protein n=1 Tax=Dreissena polymorpha TaxID=45954 RepID=A0A9D4I480_DREPO|nr:hypothetical protein DPMN_184092 [Dreissena polymorpha]
MTFNWSIDRKEGYGAPFSRSTNTREDPINCGKIRSFKDREAVRRQWKELNGSNFQVFEQFPPEVVAARRRLVPNMKDARGQGKRSWIAYDTLYVDGRPVKE